jgi:hypothetical protein
VLFEKRLRDGILDGSITLAFRRWKRPQVVAGHRYRMGAGAGLAHVVSVSMVNPSEITHADAQAAGFPNLAPLLNDLGVEAEPVYRIELCAAPEPDPRDLLSQSDILSHADLEALAHKLDRLDRSRPWTRQTLAAIAAHPAVRAADLAQQLGWQDLHEFKLHVRKLKELGLTSSLLVGYELSPRGRAFLRASSRRP